MDESLCVTNQDYFSPPASSSQFHFCSVGHFRNKWNDYCYYYYVNPIYVGMNPIYVGVKHIYLSIFSIYVGFAPFM